LLQILSADASLARWTERQRREHTILERLRTGLPPALARHIEAASATAEELTLVTTSGASAALLRQRGPALLAALDRAGWKFTVIKVRVQARSARRASEKNVLKQIDARSAARLRAGAREVADPRLRAAMNRLANAHGRRPSSEDPEGDDDEA
jgi:hypothetical protein